MGQLRPRRKCDYRGAVGCHDEVDLFSCLRWFQRYATRCACAELSNSIYYGGCPFPAGGPSDVVARIVTERMGRTLGQQMVIENVGGAGGTLGSARVAAAQPDGYTLLAGSMGSHVAAPVLTPNVKYGLRARLRPDRPHRPCARRGRCEEGFPGNEPEVTSWTT